MPESVFHILVALRQTPGNANEVLARLRHVVGRRATPSLASFYRSLKSAVDQGWIDVAADAERPGRGRPRQVYRVTDRGIRAITREAERLQHLAALALGDPVPGEGEA